MSDRWAVVLALAAGLGAMRPAPVPLVFAGAAVATALLVRRPGLLCLAVALLVSSLAWRSWEGLAGPAEPITAQGEAVLVTDPELRFGGVRAEARWQGRRVVLAAEGPAADQLEDRLAGDVLRVRGDLEPLAHPWMAARHISAELRVWTVEGWRAGPLPARVANHLRRTLVRGAEPLTPDHRALYMGLVVGDDRHQPPEMADDFLGAGLTHLLAVSGQNVAFVLLLARPMLRRLHLWPRLIAALGVIGLFGLMTRFEPSVLRASGMVALALATTTVGRPVSRLRVLALAVTGLLIVDPLLIGSVGFRLSTAAAAAIVMWSASIVDALPGPRWLCEPLGVTLTAQLGVAPVLISTFGPLPVASFPANLLAVPVAGAVMVWGMTAGMVAGWLGAPIDSVVHLVTGALLTWLLEVAERAAALPAGHLGLAHLLGLGLGVAVAAAAGRSHPRLWRPGLVLAAAALLVAVAGAVGPRPLRTVVAPGVVVWRSESTEVLVLGGIGGRSPIAAASTLAGLREAGAEAFDLVVVADPSAASVLAAVERRYPIGTVVTGPDVTVEPIGAPMVEGPAEASSFLLGDLEVRVTPTADRLVVEARRADAGWASAG